jgi:hypothetical protein
MVNQCEDIIYGGVKDDTVAKQKLQPKLLSLEGRRTFPHKEKQRNKKD